MTNFYALLMTIQWYDISFLLFNANNNTMCANNIAQHILLPANSILICFNRQNDTRINKVSDEVFEIPIRCAFKINFPRANTQKSYIANVCIMASYAKYYGRPLFLSLSWHYIVQIRVHKFHYIRFNSRESVILWYHKSWHHKCKQHEREFRDTRAHAFIASFST